MRFTVTHLDPSDPVGKPLGQVVGSDEKRGSTATGGNPQQADQINKMRQQADQINKMRQQADQINKMRQQADQINKMVKQMVTDSRAMEAWRQQTVQIGESLRQLVTSPAMEAWRNHTEVGRTMERLASQPTFETYFRQSTGDGLVESGDAPERGLGDVSEAEELLASLSDALAPPEGGFDRVPAGAVEVLALLVALLWLSALTGFWLQEARRANVPPLALNRFALATELAFLVETTRWVHRIAAMHFGNAILSDDDD
jgi:hypothetical protein